MKPYMLAVVLLFSITINAQEKLPAVDKSPLDVIYYPHNFPMLKIQDKIAEPVIARVLFSRPQKNGRTIFGDLIEYGKLWRLGANEATEIEFYQNVKVNNQRLKKGRYTLYAIPAADKWTIIFNRETDTWGSFKYDEKKDVLRVDVPVQAVAEPVEHFVMAFEKANNGFRLNMAWDNVMASLPLSL
jgi:hypothetical protein